MISDEVSETEVLVDLGNIENAAHCCGRVRWTADYDRVIGSVVGSGTEAHVRFYATFRNEDGQRAEVLEELAEAGYEVIAIHGMSGGEAAVKMAADMRTDSIRHSGVKIVILSGSKDLAEAAVDARFVGAEVVAASFDATMSDDLAKAVSGTVVLDKSLWEYGGERRYRMAEVFRWRTPTSSVRWSIWKRSWPDAGLN